VRGGTVAGVPARADGRGHHPGNRWGPGGPLVTERPRLVRHPRTMGGKGPRGRGARLCDRDRGYAEDANHGGRSTVALADASPVTESKHASVLGRRRVVSTRSSRERGYALRSKSDRHAGTAAEADTIDRYWRAQYDLCFGCLRDGPGASSPQTGATGSGNSGTSPASGEKQGRRTHAAQAATRRPDQGGSRRSRTVMKVAEEEARGPVVSPHRRGFATIRRQVRLLWTGPTGDRLRVNKRQTRPRPIRSICKLRRSLRSGDRVGATGDGLLDEPRTTLVDLSWPRLPPTEPGAHPRNVARRAQSWGHRARPRTRCAMLFYNMRFEPHPRL
jgi:hypothetical protein